MCSPLTGFSAKDKAGLCERFEKDRDEVERWYDGYLVGSMSSLTCRSFWTGTETHEALQTYIDMDFEGLRQELVAMLDGQRVLADVTGFANDMRHITSKDDCYALLVHLGYLGHDQGNDTVFIPNEEIRREFDTPIRKCSRLQQAALVHHSRELQERTLAATSHTWQELRRERTTVRQGPCATTTSRLCARQ